jgi:hypothetical protein
VTAENASKGPGQSFEGEAKSVVDAPPSKVRLPKRAGAAALAAGATLMGLFSPSKSSDPGGA